MKTLRVLLAIVLGSSTAVAARCTDGDGVAIFTSPRSPAPGTALRVIAVASEPRDAVLTVADASGKPVASARERRGGPPYWWYAALSARDAGIYRATVDGGGVTACREIAVDGATGAAGDAGRRWDRAAEDLFSAWIEKLFDDPLDAQPSWQSLHEVTRQPERNFLHDHLGLGEDDSARLRLVPDCADLPYFLRAYFAWKLGLPFGYSECSRGSGGRPPVCPRWHSTGDPHGAGGVQRFFDHLADVVQSGAPRTAAEDERTDLYPVRLAADTLRPGTVYADPYGHTLVVVRRVPQTPDSGGRLLAVDAQPDNTLARKRYWRGTFLFADDPSLGGPGFKRFRPIGRDGGALRPLSNQEIATSPDYGDYSPEQSHLAVEAFYDRIDEILSPEPLDPARAFRETIDALDEQVQARVTSVANGETYLASRPATIPMPEGAAIFETTGPWEDYATPARDLRLLIAIDVVRGFPDKVATRPQRFAMAGRAPQAARADLQATLDREARERRVTYTRSDGSPWTLTLADVMARAAALEVAYDPNDCIEVRWGAPAGSEEMSTCRRHAPADQAARMARYREWFHERRRPPR